MGWTPCCLCMLLLKSTIFGCLTPNVLLLPMCWWNQSRQFKHLIGLHGSPSCIAKDLGHLHRSIGDPTAQADGLHQQMVIAEPQPAKVSFSGFLQRPGCWNAVPKKQSTNHCVVGFCSIDWLSGKKGRKSGGNFEIIEGSLQVKLPVRTTFGSWDVEEVHAVVARSTFPSQNLQNTPCLEHFWKLRGRKSAHRCGAKHMSESKSKCTKHTTFGPLLEVEMSKKCTPLWREAHFEVKRVKNWWVRSTFGRSDVILRGRRKGLCTLSKVSRTWGFCSSFNYNHHYTTLHSTTLQLQIHIQIQLQLHYTTLITLHYTALYTNDNDNYNYTTLHYTTLHSTTLHSTTPHYTTPHHTRLTRLD